MINLSVKSSFYILNNFLYWNFLVQYSKKKHFISKPKIGGQINEDTFYTSITLLLFTESTITSFYSLKVGQSVEKPKSGNNHL